MGTWEFPGSGGKKGGRRVRTFEEPVFLQDESDATAWVGGNASDWTERGNERRAIEWGKVQIIPPQGVKNCY